MLKCLEEVYMAGILCIQINSVLENKSKNLEKIETQLSKASNRKLDLVILPEFFSTSIAYQKEPEPENVKQSKKFVNLQKNIIQTLLQELL